MGLARDSRYLQEIENFSLDELEEELERLKLRRSLAEYGAIPLVERMITAVTSLVEKRRLSDSDGPSKEAKAYVLEEVRKREQAERSVRLRRIAGLILLVTVVIFIVLIVNGKIFA